MNRISVDLDLFRTILEQESRKLVGKCMKRFENGDDKESIKKQIKELVYESFRQIIETLEVGKILFINKTEQNRKER